MEGGVEEEEEPKSLYFHVFIIVFIIVFTVSMHTPVVPLQNVFFNRHVFCTCGEMSQVLKRKTWNKCCPHKMRVTFEEIPLWGKPCVV